MADDGGWSKPAGGEPVAPDDAHARLAMGELRTVLNELERRLAEGTSNRPDTLAVLARSLETLARQVARNEVTAQGRAHELAAALGSLTQYLEIQMSSQAAREDQLNARLDRLLIELEHVRVANARRRDEPGPIRVVLAAASITALLSLVGAGVALATQDAPPIASAEASAPNS